jgi:2-dehydro-3-deoxyphosphooctonate aldolase (KDO 8-P synthase)
VVKAKQSHPVSSFSIGDEVSSVCFDGDLPVFILGPCVIEEEDFVWKLARDLKSMSLEIGIYFIFKASYDKANRSSSDSFRGPGIKEGCRMLCEISKELKIPVTTDVHTVEEVEIASENIDLLQIPAFLCRQTDLINAAGRSGRPVNVKKGQFLAPWDITPIANKLRSVGCDEFLFTERGTTFGYNNLVADMRSLFWMQKEGYRVVFDATHSVQKPGGLGDKSSGDGYLAPVLARAAVATGCDGVFIETHPNPDKAMSDGPNQIPLSNLSSVLKTLLAIHKITSAGSYEKEKENEG